MEYGNFKHVYLRTMFLCLQTYLKMRQTCSPYFFRCTHLQHHSPVNNSKAKVSFLKFIFKLQWEVNARILVGNS